MYFAYVELVNFSWLEIRIPSFWIFQSCRGFVLHFHGLSTGRGPTIINISDVAVGAVFSIYFRFGAGSAGRSFIKPTDELLNYMFHDNVGNCWPTSQRFFDCSLSICFVTASCFHDVACLSFGLSS